MIFKKVFLMVLILLALFLFVSCNSGQKIEEPEEPETATEWILKGFEYNQKGKFEEAIKCFDKAIELEPEKTGDSLEK